MCERLCSASRIGRNGAEGTARSPITSAIFDHSHQAVNRIRDIAIRGPNDAPSCRNERPPFVQGLLERVEDDLLDSNTICSIKYIDSSATRPGLWPVSADDGNAGLELSGAPFYLRAS